MVFAPVGTGVLVLALVRSNPFAPIASYAVNDQGDLTRGAVQPGIGSLPAALTA